MGLTIGGRDYSGIAAMTLSSAFAQAQAQQRAARAAAQQQGLENSQKQQALDDTKSYQQGDLNLRNMTLSDVDRRNRITDLRAQQAPIAAKLGTFRPGDPAASDLLNAYNSLDFQINALSGSPSPGAEPGSSPGGNYQPSGTGASPQAPPAVTGPDFTPKPITAGVGLRGMSLQQAAAMATPTPTSQLQQYAPQTPPAGAPPTQSPLLQAATAGGFNPYAMTPAEQAAADLATRKSEEDLKVSQSTAGNNWAQAGEHASMGNKNDADAGAALQKTAVDAHAALAGLTNPDGSPNVAAQNNMVDQINAANPNLVLPHVKADGSNAYKMDLSTFANIQKTFADATGARVGAYKTAAEAGEVAPNAASDRLKADREGQAAMLNASTNFKQFGLDQQKFIMDDPALPAMITRMDTLDNNIGQADEKKRLAIQGYTVDADGNKTPIPDADRQAIAAGEDAQINAWKAEKDGLKGTINSRMKSRASMVPPAGIGPPGSAVRGDVQLQNVPKLPGFGQPDSTAPGAYKDMRPVDRMKLFLKYSGSGSKGTK